MSAPGNAVAPMLEVRGLAVSYGKVEAVRQVDLRVGAGPRDHSSVVQ